MWTPFSPPGAQVADEASRAEGKRLWLPGLLPYQASRPAAAAGGRHRQHQSRGNLQQAGQALHAGSGVERPGPQAETQVS